jgi:hypothetical protein
MGGTVTAPLLNDTPPLLDPARRPPAPVRRGDRSASAAPGITTPIAPLIVVRPWVDPVVEQAGYDPHSRYVELFWLGIIGPTATWLLRRLADGLATYPDGFELDLVETASALGLTLAPGSRSGPFARALGRCVLFGMAYLSPSELAVRRKVAPLAARHIERLPPHLRAAHRAWERRDEHMESDRSRAEAIAEVLLRAGDDAEGIERRLLMMGLGPQAVRVAMRRAYDRTYEPAEVREGDEAAAAAGGA